MCLAWGREQHFSIATRQTDEAAVDTETFSAIGQSLATTAANLHADRHAARSACIACFERRAWRRRSGRSQHDEFPLVLEDEGVAASFQL